MRNLINLHFSLFLALFKKPIEIPIEVDNYLQYGLKAPFIKAVEKVSGKTFDEIRSNRKSENVFWKAIFANLVFEYVFVQGTHLECAIILKVDRTSIYHYLYHYKKSSKFDEMLIKTKKEYEAGI